MASPMPFRDLAGHRRLFELLSRAAMRGSLPPSLVFAGPDGVGKRAAAVALAQLVNCLDLPAGAGQDGPADACGACAACRRIARGVHADVLELAPGDSGAIKVDDVREAIDRAAYRPFEGRRRVVIVDEAQALNAEAQNALLKTLEEPPPASTFVLVTSRPDVLLPTVRSRCQRIRFGRLTEAEVAGVLVSRHKYSEADAHAAAAAADGSVGRALEGGSAEVTDARAAAARLLAGALTPRDAVERLALARELASGGGRGEREALGRKLRAMASLVRDLGVLASAADDRWLANADLRADLEALLHTWNADRALRAFATVDRALAALDRNASPKVVADWLAVEL